MPSPKSSKSPKRRSPNKRGTSKSPPKSSRSGDANSFADKIASRIRYSKMGAVFKKCSENVSVYLESIHIYESWNRLPPYEQFCNSNQSPGRSRKSSPNRSKKTSPGKSRKSTPKKTDEKEDSRPDFEPAILSGAVAFRKTSCQTGVQLMAEVTASFKYTTEYRRPVYGDSVSTECVCYRKSKVLYPLSFETMEFTSAFLQRITTKVKSTLGYGYKIIPFIFDLTRCPDSVFLNRPHYPLFTSGVLWSLRVFFAPDLVCEPEPENDVSINFYKYTIAPFWMNKTFLPYNQVEYIRHGTANDTGDLILRAYLERDIYYHGQDILVTVEIENQSSIYSIQTISIYVEQTYRFRLFLPQDSSIPLGEVILNSSNSNLPVRPKQRSWTKTVTLRPQFDQTKHNLAIDGKAQIDNKIFLASSTMVLITTRKEVVVERTSPARSRENSPKSSPSKKSDKTSPRGKSEGSRKTKSPKTKSPGKGSPGKKSPKKQSPQNKLKDKGKSGEVAVQPKPTEYIEEHNLTNTQTCRTLYISYDVVVRLSLSPASGTPMVRLPFILTRESRYLDKYGVATAPQWDVWKPD